MQSRIMYIERKEDGIVGPARIGRVEFSKTGKTLYYKNKEFASLKGSGFKTNYYDVETEEEYWISGCRRDGNNALYNTEVEIDNDVREEYWRDIRNEPENVHVKTLRMMGKY